MGETLRLTATLRSASGAVLTGRLIEWSSSNVEVATVAQAGAVTAVGPGSVTIVATSEGVAGSAQVAITPRVTSVAITGPTRVKVGDSYKYVAMAYTADGSIIERSVSWRVVEPSRGIMGADGILIPLRAGSMTLEALIDKVAWLTTVPVVAYDWESIVASGGVAKTLQADAHLTNRHGRSLYPILSLECVSSSFMVRISLRDLIPRNGTVTMRLGNGPVTTLVWKVTNDFSGLDYPGLGNLAHEGFAAALANAGTLEITFGELFGQNHTAVFRLTGLWAELHPLLATCSDNGMVATNEG